MDVTQGLYQPEMNYHDTGFTIKLVETINHKKELQMVCQLTDEDIEILSDLLIRKKLEALYTKDDELMKEIDLSVSKMIQFIKRYLEKLREMSEEADKNNKKQ